MTAASSSFAEPQPDRSIKAVALIAIGLIIDCIFVNILVIDY